MVNQGRVLVRVYTSRAQIPVEGASVAITRPAGGKHEVIAVRTTDESGLTPAIPIPAPAAAESEAPGHAHPYATVDVWVSHPAYQSLRASGVQIFSGVETVQDAELLPLPEYPDKQDLSARVDTTPQPL